MQLLDWAILAAYFTWMIADGLRRSKTRDVEEYLLAGRSLPWWAVGLSVMATQLSAITLVGTTGQAYSTGLRFIQFYLGLPLAMVLLSLTVVPFFHRAKVFTAYEYLEQRFDVRTRTLASFLFLMGRVFALGVVLSAPGVVMSTILGWSLSTTVLLIGLPTVVYTALGGVQAVAWTDVKQMFVIVLGMGAAVVVLLAGILPHLEFSRVLDLAGATGRLEAIDFSVNPNDPYTFWSGLIGGLFLSLAYFGCDQSQVQRYLTARSIDEARHSLMMSAYAKIPLQLLILAAGVLVFVFYVVRPSPMLFNPAYEARVTASPLAADYAALEGRFAEASAERARAAQSGDQREFLAADGRVQQVRAEAAAVVKQASGDERYTDVNFVFPTFIVNELPVGLVGLMIAAIFAAAMSTAAGELSALSTATVIDFYKRHFVPSAADAHYLIASRVATLLWGLFACVVGMFAANQGSLIEVVNRYGSFFYGSLLGVFMLAILTRRATATGAFWGLIAGMAVVLYVALRYENEVAFLWHNVIGAVVVVAVGMTLSLLGPSPPSAPKA